MDTQRFPGPRMRPGRMQLARAYVPFQQYKDNYSLEEALLKGTFFPELWRPYLPNRRRKMEVD